MHKKIVSVIIALAGAFLFITALQASSTPIPGLQWHILENGLEVFVFESHAVPLVKIEVVFRCGALAQTPGTAGLFHLYEHMLFKGNRIFKSDSDFQAAMKELGVTSWNGGTSNEFVNYYFTVPSDKIESALAFWAAAVRYPLFLKDELATEKKVVINEIRGTHNEPARILSGAINNRLFYKYPWRKDTTGSETNVANTTVKDLEDIRNTYYIPNNAALLIGGDVGPEEALRLARKYFGDWQRGPDPWKSPPPPHPRLFESSALVHADESMYKEIAGIEILFRGPDVLADPLDTYAADIWLMLLEDPSGPFVNSIMEKVPGIYKKEATRASYFTQRDGGMIFFQTLVRVMPDKDTAASLLAVKKVIIDEMAEIVKNPDYFSSAHFSLVKTRLEDQMIMSRETGSRFIENLSFWWSTASSDYFFTYLDRMKSITVRDINKFIEKYLLSQESVIAVSVNPAVFETEKTNFENASFEQITVDNAYWWQNQGKVQYEK